MLLLQFLKEMLTMDQLIQEKIFFKMHQHSLTFPTDLKGMTIVISVEPSPDNSPAPFALKPLAHMVPTNASNHTTINMGTGYVASISGSVIR